MAFQPSVAEYFNSRKRPADDIKKNANPTKVLVVDESLSTVDVTNNDFKLKNPLKKIVYSSREVSSTCLNRKLKSQTGNKSSASKAKKKLKPDGCQMDIRKTLFKTSVPAEEEPKSFPVKDLPDPTKDEERLPEEYDLEKSEGKNVPFHVKGGLSPTKRKLSEPVLNRPEDSQSEPQSALTTAGAGTSTLSSRKELNLGNIKAMMSRSSRLEEMKAALKRFNENKAKLNEEQGLAETHSPENDPSLLPISPLKTPKKAVVGVSPQGKLTPSRLFATPPPRSPLKSPLASPAFQRYQALVTEGRPTLALPFKYRALAELFRCVDTVASMLHNRKETITLTKLRPGVQEISRKNLTEYQLGQMKTVFPDAFEFSLEKMRSFGSVEKYELVLTPLLPGEGQQIMGPKALLARRRQLYNALLELTKDYHEEFLRSLEPPMTIPRSRLTRWHPEFLVDEVPDIIAAALPQPPTTDKVTTAKDVLERARSLFEVNPRMQRALQRVSENRQAPTLSPPGLERHAPTSTSSRPPLHGVPASLLERVRAKQAARALEAMTRTPSQAKQAVRLSRLPEIARILRNLFVGEKKSVLPREVVLLKLADSYRENLSQGELDEHMQLLAEQTPGWITFYHLRSTDFVKLSRSADMSRIMSRLEAAVADNCV